MRCKTRYCNSTCQHDHWRRGHKQICKKIHRGGNAEQYNADKKCKEAVAIAVEACADDTKGQKCYICLEAVHPRTGEGLVRGCACGDRDGVSSPELGVAHVSCLAEQAKILFEEGEENKLDWTAKNARFGQWYSCGLCEQDYHGFVRCALGWACWKTYVGRLEVDQVHQMSLTQLGNGLGEASAHEDALSVKEAVLSMSRRLGAREESMLAAQGNLATSYEMLGRLKEGVRMRQCVYSGTLKLNGEEHRDTFAAAHNYAQTLLTLKKYEEGKSLLRRTIPMARRSLGESEQITLALRINYAVANYMRTGATLDELGEAVNTLEETERIALRVFGGAHPLTTTIEVDLRSARTVLRTREAGGV